MTIMNNFLSGTDSFYSFVLPMLWDTNQDQDPTVLLSVQALNKKLFLLPKGLTNLMSTLDREFICRGCDVQVG